MPALVTSRPNALVNVGSSRRVDCLQHVGILELFFWYETNTHGQSSRGASSYRYEYWSDRGPRFLAFRSVSSIITSSNHQVQEAVFPSKRALHGRRNHILKADQPRQFPGSDVELVSVFETDFVQEKLLGFVDGLHAGIVGNRSIAQRETRISGYAFLGVFGWKDFCLGKKFLFLLPRTGSAARRE
jgi:hypothetical protein